MSLKVVIGHRGDGGMFSNIKQSRLVQIETTKYYSSSGDAYSLGEKLKEIKQTNRQRKF